MNAGKKLEGIFAKLDERIKALNRERREEGMLGATKVEVRLLGQMSLLVNQEAAATLSLAQTADLDAFLLIDSFVKDEFKKILAEEGLVYDEDSHLIWIPEGAHFDKVFSFQNILVLSVDPESALVSKAVKAPQKNKQLIREAIASGAFPKLVDRILSSGGDLEQFT